MVSPRARWLAARTRNAARHGLLIAGSGVIVMIAALLTFVLVPRQVDRALSAALSLMPLARDTLVLQRARSVAADSLAAVTDRRTASMMAATVGTDSLGLVPADSLPRTVAVPLGDTVLAAVQRQLVRARQTPLVESFRALADVALVHPGLRSRGAVSALRDSIEQLDRERDAYAALSGPDARYAAMTARLMRLGEQLVRAVEQALPRERPPGDSLVVAAQGPIPADRTVPALIGTVSPDSLLNAAQRAAEQQLSVIDSTLAEARAFNAALGTRKEALRSRMQLSIPPVAMLLASLVLGVVAGFSVALWRELRRPTVGDAQELETLTHSRVIVHDRDAGARRTRRTRRGEAVVPALSPTDDAWPLLHLTLSHIGDMTRHVQVLADRPVLAGAVGLNLSAVAARESRATALVDAAQRAGAIIPLLPVSVLAPRGDRSAHDDDPDWDLSRELPLGRDAAVALVLPRRARSYRHRGAAPAGAANSGGAAAQERDERRALKVRLRHFDFVVFVTDSSRAPVLPPDRDLVLCARLGVTPLAWLAGAVRQADDTGRRIRAVVLWASDVPLAG